jgi:hypothetical protein
MNEDFGGVPRFDWDTHQIIVKPRRLLLPMAGHNNTLGIESCKAGGLQKRGALKLILSSEFHHIIGHSPSSFSLLFFFLINFLKKQDICLVVS